MSGTASAPAALDRLGGAICAVAPHLSASSGAAWAAALIAPMRSSGITTPRRIAAFLGQIAVESAAFSAVEENMNYSAERLCEVWPTHFSSVSGPDATSCEHNPEVLANYIYADRMGNGDETSGDGWKYHGRGLIQITGKANYEALARADARAADPDWLKTPEGASISACWFWTQRKPSLNIMSDGWQITNISKAINGGTNGLSERIALSNTAFRCLS